MLSQYVKACVKLNKNDAADAQAICEAGVRPTMRFVPAERAEQQAAMLLHRGQNRRRKLSAKLITRISLRSCMTSPSEANALCSRAPKVEV
jgi:transposase